MYILKCICPSVLLSYCSPRPSKKAYFPTKPFIPSRNSSHVTRSYDPSKIFKRKVAESLRFIFDHGMYRMNEKVSFLS